jgi:glycosyltransferase involved in cell wall biosynthesis
MDVTVVIPTRNRANLLRQTIESIASQTVHQDDYELIVVDNGSSDGTSNVVKSFMGKIRNMRYCRTENPGLHVARHRGLAESSTALLIYGDDDIISFPTWIEGVRESFRDPSVAVVGGNNMPKYESPPPPWVDRLWYETPWGRVLSYYSLIDFGDVVKEIPSDFVWGCNFSIRKPILREAGGFHPDSMPRSLQKYRGDGESYVSAFVKRNNFKTLFHPEASVYHQVPRLRMNRRYLRKRAFLQGMSDSYTDIREAGRVSARMKVKGLFRVLNHFKYVGFPRFSEPYRSLLLGYYEGYHYHQKMVVNDRELLSWVVQDDYFAEDDRH